MSRSLRRALLCLLAVVPFLAVIPASASDPGPIQLRSLLLPTTSVSQGQSVTASAVLDSTSGTTNVDAVTIAVRQGSTQYDFPGATAASVPSTGYTYTSGARSFPAGTYDVYVSYEIGSSWYPLTPHQTLTVGGPGVVVDSVTVPVNAAGNTSVSASAKVHSTSGTIAVQAITLAVRQGSTSFDFPGATAASIPTSGYTFTSGSRTFPVGNYDVFVAVEINNTWTNLTPDTSMTIDGAAKLSDEFTGASGAGPNTGLATPIWYTDPCWKNGCTGTEAEYRDDHATLDGNGNLVLKADRNFTAKAQCGSNACTWGAARLTTLNWAAGKAAFSQAGGYFEARIKSPLGQGLWPAFWTVGANQITGTQWPASGEIDMVEQQGQRPTHVDQYGHAGATVAEDINYSSGGYTFPAGDISGWHTYGISWDNSANGYIQWYVDGKLTQTLTAAQAGNGVNSDGTPSSTNKWQYLQKAQALILDLAVGGQDGASDTSTPSSSSMLVDYVRTYTTPLPKIGS